MAKKRSGEQELRKGLDQLRTLGVPVAEPAASLIAVLKSHLGRGRETDLAVVFLLGRILDAGSVALLAELEKSAVDKDLKKEIRRSLFRLSQRGIDVPEPQEIRGSDQRPVFKLAPEIEGYLSSVDGAGGRLVWLAKAQSGSGLLLLQGMVSDREGLVRVGGTVVRRKELRQMIREIQDKHGVTMISIPWEYGDQLFYEAFEKARALGGREEIKQFFSLRAPFNLGKPQAPAHPIYSRLDPAEARSGAWRELSRRLLDEPEFRLWILDEDWMKPYWDQIQAAQESRLVLNEVQKEERFAAIVAQAVGEIFSGERGRIFRRRMEDMALYLLETKREQPAKWALAVALAIEAGDPSSLGALDITFLTGLIQKSLAFYLSRAKEKAAEEPSLIVKP